ncbi:MAG: desulfoferrodoxin family protein [Candidatus Omnitrophota bacterium]
MKGLVCKVCGYISIDGAAPDACPVCHAPKSSFQENAEAVKTPRDINDMTELEKKHSPVILVLKKCGLIEGCVDVHVKIGAILHPTLPEHSIGHVDFYIDKKFISRVILTPEKLNPACALHLKASEGRLSAIALCNIHGAWLGEINL